MGLNFSFNGLLTSTFIRRDNGAIVKARLLTNTMPTLNRDEALVATSSISQFYTSSELPIGVELLGDYQGRKVLVQVLHFTPRRILLATPTLGHVYQVKLTYLKLNSKVNL